MATSRNSSVIGLGSKKEIECPSCKNSQSEPKLAVSTNCRACGVYISLDHSTPPPRSEKLEKAEDGQMLSAAERLKLVARGEFEPAKTRQPIKLGWRGREIRCYECGSDYGAVGGAKSAACPRCGSYVSFQNYDIRNCTNIDVVTCGNVIVRKSGTVQSTKLVCHNLKVIDGGVYGKINCTGDFIFSGSTTIMGSITCRQITIAAGSSLTCYQPIIAETAQLAGELIANITCEGAIKIGPVGLLQGNVTAGAVIIEDGGSLDGITRIVRKGSEPPKMPRELDPEGEDDEDEDGKPKKKKRKKAPTERAND